MRFYKIILLFCIVIFSQCTSVKHISQNKSTQMDVYLCIGQSNMAGRAVIEEEDKGVLKNVYLFKRGVDNVWEEATNPLNKYSTIRKKIEIQKLGPSYGFAKTMIEENPNQKIGLVVNAKGGSSIEAWKPGSLFYNEAINQTKRALALGGKLKGVIWHQGESNSSKYKKYLPQIVELISSLREDLNIPNLPFVAGQLSEDKPKRKKFNAMILRLPNTLENTAVVSTKNTSTIDDTHFDNESQKILGERYAKKMLELLNKKQ